MLSSLFHRDAVFFDLFDELARLVVYTPTAFSPPPA